MTKEKRKIMLVSADRAERSLQEPIMGELKKIDSVDVTWCLLDSHARPEENLISFRNELGRFKPEIVVVPTDRTEIVYIAAFAFHQGYIVAHFHAGNNPSNHPDDINRRVISCFSHIMFANMEDHRANLIRQGEDPSRIYLVGSTAFDDIIFDDTVIPTEPFDLVILHPNPSSKEETESDLQKVIKEIKNSKKVVWIYPNHDLNYEVIENYLESLSPSDKIIKSKGFTREQYYSLLKNCARAIGNSSSFYYEFPVLNDRSPLVQIGERNKGLKVSYTKAGGSKRIAKILSTIEITTELRKRWNVSL